MQFGIRILWHLALWRRRLVRDMTGVHPICESDVAIGILNDEAGRILKGVRATVRFRDAFFALLVRRSRFVSHANLSVRSLERGRNDMRPFATLNRRNRNFIATRRNRFHALWRFCNRSGYSWLWCVQSENLLIALGAFH